MRSFPTNFAAAKNTRAGVSPLWILKLVVNSATYYISDQAVTISGWNGGVTTKPWISNWGSVQEQISGEVTEARVSDLRVSCLIDQSASPNIETLATATDIEKSAAVLYLWFVGLNATTDPPQEVFTGYVRDVAIPDDITVDLSLEDATVRLHNMVGTLVTTTAYPNADPDHIGKILPIPFGTVCNVPAVATVSGLLTTLKADITAAATSCAVARPDGITNTTQFKIGSEIVLVTAVSGDTLTISRAQDSTTAATHTAGDRLLEVVASPFVFVVSGHALTSIDKVVVRSGETDVDVTDQCTKYTGQAGNQYSTYGEKGVVTVSQAQASVIQGRVLKAAEASVGDPGHIHTSNLAVVAVSPDSSNPNTSVWRSVYDGSTLTGTFAIAGVETSADLHITRAAGLPGVIKRIRVAGVATTSSTYSGMGVNLYFKGSYKAGVTLVSDGVTRTSAWFTVPAADSSWLNILSSAKTFIRISKRTAYDEKIDEAWMEVEYDPSPDSSTAGVSVSINSVADQLIGGQVHADVTSPTTAPNAVIGSLLSTWGGGASVTLDGSYPAGYAFNGVLLKQEKLLDVVQRLAWQSRSWFKVMSGSARLVVRPTTLTSEKTISTCRVEDGSRVLSREKTAVDDIVNVINLRYGRDWTKVDGDDAYKLVSSTSDATSIADYGTREKPEFFRMDMVATQTMADSLRDFYLADLKRRKWLHEFEVFLDQAELEFGDIVTLGFAGNAVIELMQVGVVPGDTDQIDRIRMVGRG